MACSHDLRYQAGEDKVHAEASVTLPIVKPRIMREIRAN